MILVFLHKYNNTFQSYFHHLVTFWSRSLLDTDICPILSSDDGEIQNKKSLYCFSSLYFLYYVWVSHFVYDRNPIQNCFGFRHVEEAAAIIETLVKLVSHTEIKAKVIVKKKRGLGWGVLLIPWSCFGLYGWLFYCFVSLCGQFKL